MFKVTRNDSLAGQLGGPFYEVMGEAGGRTIRLSALNEIHACEIALALNSAATIEIEEPMEVTSEEEAAWRDFDTRR